MSKPESLFKALLLKEYEDRLNSFSMINETKVTNDDGRVILDPDLKVRHKKSGFEYTIKKVNDEDGVISIVLRTPDTPRFSDQAIPGQVIAGKEPESNEYAKPKKDNDSFEVSQQDFEKEYEVD
mgnify:CR=1 FL=1